MQPQRQLESVLRRIATPESYLFSLADLEAILPERGHNAVKMIVGRATRSGVLSRACHGIYLFDQSGRKKGWELFHIAAKLRPGNFNYISQESALSDLGIISQVPFQHITVMTSGSSSLVDCGPWGRIEFTHTAKDPSSLTGCLIYDRECRMLRATAGLAVSDLRAARRNLGMIDGEAAREHAV